MYGNPYYNMRGAGVSNSMVLDEGGEVRQSVMSVTGHSRVRSSTNYDYKLGSG